MLETKDLIQGWKDDGKQILVVYVPDALDRISKRFFRSFVNVMSPEVQHEMDSKYNVKMICMPHDKFPIDFNRNSAIDRAEREFKADYIMSMDADMTFPKDTIPRLFSHISDDTPVVTGIYWRKAGSMRCVTGTYAPLARHEAKKASLLSQGFLSDDGQSQYLYYQPMTCYDIPGCVDVSGMGCLLLRLDVFKRLELPYFKYTNGYANGGDFTLDHSSEEMWLFMQLKRKGIKVMCDPSVKCGHLLEKEIGCPEQ